MEYTMTMTKAKTLVVKLLILSPEVAKNCLDCIEEDELRRFNSTRAPAIPDFVPLYSVGFECHTGAPIRFVLVDARSVAPNTLFSAQRQRWTFQLLTIASFKIVELADRRPLTPM
jgi:hypothetical protein